MGQISPPPPPTWYDSAFAQLYRLDHRYLVELAAVILVAVLLHLGYGVLSDRQREFAIQREANNLDHVSNPTISIGTITNSGAGSSTQITQEVPKQKTASK
jgi:hypothetical protein